MKGQIRKEVALLAVTVVVSVALLILMLNYASQYPILFGLIPIILGAFLVAFSLYFAPAPAQSPVEPDPGRAGGAASGEEMKFLEEVVKASAMREAAGTEAAEPAESEKVKGKGEAVEVGKAGKGKKGRRTGRRKALRGRKA